MKTRCRPSRSGTCQGVLGLLCFSFLECWKSGVDFWKSGVDFYG